MLHMASDGETRDRGPFVLHLELNLMICIAAIVSLSSENKLISVCISCSYSGAYKIGEIVFPEGTGRNKQTAKFNAAKLAYEQLNSRPTSRVCITFTVMLKW